MSDGDEPYEFDSGHFARSNDRASSFCSSGAACITRHPGEDPQGFTRPW